MKILELVLYGRPITKKNSQIKTKNGIIQSQQYRCYEAELLHQLTGERRKVRIKRSLNKEVVRGNYEIQHQQRYRKNQIAVFDSKDRLHLQALFYYPTTGYPDLVGLIQSVQDILQKAGVYPDDNQIALLDGSTIVGKDKEYPRVEIRLKAI